MGGLDAASLMWPEVGGLLITAETLLPTCCRHLFAGNLNTVNLLQRQLAAGAGWRAGWAGEWAVRGGR